MSMGTADLGTPAINSLYRFMTSSWRLKMPTGRVLEVIARLKLLSCSPLAGGQISTSILMLGFYSSNFFAIHFSQSPYSPFGSLPVTPHYSDVEECSELLQVSLSPPSPWWRTAEVWQRTQPIEPELTHL